MAKTNKFLEKQSKHGNLSFVLKRAPMIASRILFECTWFIYFKDIIIAQIEISHHNKLPGIHRPK